MLGFSVLNLQRRQFADEAARNVGRDELLDLQRRELRVAQRLRERAQAEAVRLPAVGALDEKNRRRGAQGEELVADYERSWLRQHGRPDLAGRVRWTARDDGDGLGSDVLSYDLDGHERYIEVKTTRLAWKHPSTSPPPNWTSRGATPPATP